MSILILATSGPHGELGLARPGGTLEVVPLAAGAARGRGVMPAVRALLEGDGPAGIEAIVVDVGPGSFTGVRVGVTTAKALAFSLDVPVVGVTSLLAMAETAAPDASVLPVRDAGRGRLYYAWYGPVEGDERPLLAGPGRAFPDEIADRTGGLEPCRHDATAAAFLAVGRRALEAGRARPAHVLAPVYLQASAPERRRAGEPEPEK